MKKIKKKILKKTGEPEMLKIKILIEKIKAQQNRERAIMSSYIFI